MLPNLLRTRLPALQHRDFAIFWAAHVVSRIGTQMREVALGWHLYVLTKSPLALGLLGAFRVAPILALALGGGVVADAFDRRRLMLVTHSLFLLASALLAWLTTAGSATPGLLYGMVALSAAAAAFDNPARQALTVNLLPERDLPNGLTLSILGWQLATVIGPAIAGLLLHVVAIEVIYAIDAVSFLAVLGALLVVRPRFGLAAGGAARAAGVAGVSFRAVMEAISFLRKKPVLVWLMVVDFTATFFAGSLQQLPIFAEEIFKVGTLGFGFLTSAPAAGALVASAWMSSRPPVRRYGATVLGAVMVYGACAAGFGLTSYFPLALVLLAGTGAADTVSTVVRQVVRQTLTPDELRGRMTGINMMFFVSGPQLGEVETGVVAKLTGSVRAAVVSGGILCIFASALIAALAPGLRRLRREDPSDRGDGEGEGVTAEIAPGARPAPKSG
jgi:MFS family permease